MNMRHARKVAVSRERRAALAKQRRSEMYSLPSDLLVLPALYAREAAAFELVRIKPSERL
jgi:hypothetical protein